MYRIQEKYKTLVAKYAWTKLDINAAYSKEEWIKNGFREYILEEVK